MVALCCIFPTLILGKHTSSRQPPKTTSFVAKSSAVSMPAPLAPCKMGTLDLHLLGLPWDCGGRLRELLALHLAQSQAAQTQLSSLRGPYCLLLTWQLVCWAS